MVKNSSRYLKTLWETIKSFSYPKDKLNVYFIYGNSNDNTLDILRDITKDREINVEVYREPGDPYLKKYGQFMGARIWDDFRDLSKGEYFLLMDVHIEEAPSDLLEKLISYDEDIIAPYPYIKSTGTFYDTWIFRKNNLRFHHIYPYGMGFNVPIEVDSVCATLLWLWKLWYIED